MASSKVDIWVTTPKALAPGFHAQLVGSSPKESLSLYLLLLIQPQREALWALEVSELPGCFNK